MKVLVIHPKDRTTDFLSVIYKDYEKYLTVITEPCSKSHLKRSIRDHDYVIMLGHGSEKGLYGFNRMVIDSSFVYLLREKSDSMYIWCNADKFTTKYGLSGFCTGMIISEYEEAMNYAVQATDEEIEISNKKFAEAVRDSLTRFILRSFLKITPNYTIRDSIYSIYSDALSNTSNPVIDFNIKNLQYR